MSHVVVVGASLAGYRTVQALRQKGFDGRITLVGAESHLPYDRPPLSKRVLLDDEMPSSALTDDAGLRTLDVHTRLGSAATGLIRVPQELTPESLGAVSGTTSWRVRLADGEEITADRVVVATGAAAVQPFTPAPAGVVTLRTVEDALAVRSLIASARRLVVVGGGFIGAEVACAAVTHGVDVTVVESAPAPLVRAVGPVVGQRCADLHVRHGVRVRCGVPVAAIEGGDRVTGVRLADGEVLPADAVVVGVGASPVAGWLAGSGLTVDDGVVADATGAADPDGSVFAVGDVARWWHPLFGRSLRVEHWSHAVEQAQVVAHNVVASLAGPGRDGWRELSSVPYVWSDQYDVKIQVAGLPSPDADLWVDDTDPDRLTALYGRDGVLVGAVVFNRPQVIARARRLIATGTTWQDAITAISAAPSRRPQPTPV